MIRNICLYGDNILNRSCAPVVEFNEELEEFVLDMIETLKHNKALGLSAPQVGVSKRIFVIAQPENTRPLIFINPSIIEHTMDLKDEDEGCLSLPGITCSVPRFTEITVYYQDTDGSHQTAVLEDLEARIFQHELDHLNGCLMTRYLSTVRFGLIQGKLKKINNYRKFIQKHGNIINQIRLHSENRETGVPETSRTIIESVVQPGQES